MKTSIEKQKRRFIDKLQFQLDKSGMTQKQFCDACGISRPSLWRYLNGDYWPSIENLISISSFCEVELSYWFVKDAPVRITKDTMTRE